MCDVDDETDEDMMAAALEKAWPDGIEVSNIDLVPGRSASLVNGRSIMLLSRIRLPEDKRNSRLNQLVSSVFHNVYSRLCFAARNYAPCCLLNLSHCISLTDEDELQILVTGMAMIDPLSSMSSESKSLEGKLYPPLMGGVISQIINDCRLRNTTKEDRKMNSMFMPTACVLNRPTDTTWDTTTCYSNHG